MDEITRDKMINDLMDIDYSSESRECIIAELKRYKYMKKSDQEIKERWIHLFND